MDIVDLAKSNEDLLIKIRRELHKIPELGLELPKTMGLIGSYLDEFGIPFKTLLGGNAIVATVTGSSEGPVLAIRADADALPIKEETSLSFKSEHEGKMHACGHDGHSAAALIAAKILNENKDKLKGTVKFFFQPGEEFPGGASPMIEEGCMENPHVDAVIGQHAGRLLPVPQGKIGIKEGAIMASMDRFQITVKGKGSHGAQPHLSNDVICVASEIVSSLQKIISRGLNPTSAAVVSVCQFHAGSSQNIIPDEAFLEGTVRALDEDERKFIARRIGEISEKIAEAYDAKIDYNYEFKYPVVVNDPNFTKFFEGVVRKYLGDEYVFKIDLPTMGGEDMAFFLQKAPGTFFMLSNPVLHEDGSFYPHHNSRFDLDESHLYKSVAMFVATSFEFLS